MKQYDFTQVDDYFTHTNLHNHIQLAIKHSGQVLVFWIIIALNIVEALCVVFIRYLEFDIVKNLDSHSTIIHTLSYICILWSARQIVWHVILITHLSFNLRLKKKLQNTYLTIFMSHSSLVWLESQKTDDIYSAIDKGVDAIVDVMNIFMGSINPASQLLGSMFTVYTVSEWNTLSLIGIFFATIFLLGVYLLYWDTEQRKKIEVLKTPLISYNTHLSKHLFDERLNLNEQPMIQKILANRAFGLEKNLNITSVVQYGYSGIEIFGMLFLILLLWSLQPQASPPILLACYEALMTSISRTWSLFHKCSDMSKSASKWGALELYLKKFVPSMLHDQQKQTKRDNPNVRTIPIPYTIHSRQSQEFQIVGKSGCGKTTWMKQEIVRCLYAKHLLGQNLEWIYLSQSQILPITKSISALNYLTQFNRFHYTQASILQWATMLDLDEVINEHSLSSSFIKPSGGEVKRIIFLQQLLPVLTRQKTIQLLFCDEIAAGLDPQSFKCIRHLLHILKSNYNVQVISIEHHTLTESSIIPIHVRQTSTQYSLGATLHRQNSLHPKKKNLWKQLCKKMSKTKQENVFTDYPQLPYIMETF